MATGAGERYWSGQALPSVFKHTLLDKYVPQFAGMTGSIGRRVVYLDGYAGRGRYTDGTPASAEKILMVAQSQFERVGLAWTCYFVEQDPESARALGDVVAEYVAQGVTALAHRGDVQDVLDQVIRSAVGCPLFAFLDPCGLGLPFNRMSGLLNGERKKEWPPTEFLLNFSLDAVRRIGGHVTGQRNEATLRRMDDAVGGRWWRELFSNGVNDAAVEAVVAGFSERMSAATGMHLVAVPVRRAPTHKPVYDLIFGSRKAHGLWVFGDAVARATQAWWDTLEEVEVEADPDALFPATATIRPVLETVEERALPVITDNLRYLLHSHPAGFRVVDHTRAVFGEFYGQVRESVVRKAVKALHQQGGTATTGVGGTKRTRDLVVLPPTAA
ncbi:three-Cys-motif partner protein TcmP [Geodermatophilus ruber]|uniref:Three-Cys-motif partner protein n=1 Tax=Geodermatophilus ruber TaxID=504800 RepID=A0A1I4D0S4_9ACTN|nr:three-Cys-motif partner protein TcmP [Geodermatophilus ruber]SFK85786.1 three-Cys-motif partner protein [Geodermatophilus ruber]